MTLESRIILRLATDADIHALQLLIEARHTAHRRSHLLPPNPLAISGLQAVADGPNAKPCSAQTVAPVVNPSCSTQQPTPLRCMPSLFILTPPDISQRPPKAAFLLALRPAKPYADFSVGFMLGTQDNLDCGCSWWSGCRRDATVPAALHMTAQLAPVHEERADFVYYANQLSRPTR